MATPDVHGEDRRHSLEAVANSLVDELASAVNDPGLAKVIAVRAGYPAAELPSFVRALTFWHEVVHDTFHGKAHLGKLASVAAEHYTENSRFREYSETITRLMDTTRTEPLSVTSKHGPRLIFKYSSNEHKWYIKNIGTTEALNPLLGARRGRAGRWSGLVRIAALGSGEAIPLAWALRDNIHDFAAVYEDEAGSRYWTVAYDEENIFTDAPDFGENPRGRARPPHELTSSSVWPLNDE